MSKTRFFAVVDTWTMDEQGKPMVQNPRRDTIVCVNRPAYTSQDGVFHPAVCRSADCRPDGIYAVSEMDEFAKEKIAILTSKVNGGTLIGPFDSVQEALIAKEKARPKSEVEKLREENEALKAQIAQRGKAASKLIEG